MAGNAITHGILSKNLLPPGVSRRKWNSHLQGFWDSYGPTSYAQERYIREAALADLKLEVIDQVEAAAVQNQLETIDDPYLQDPADINQLSEGEQIWLSTDPIGASLLFNQFSVLADDENVDVGVATALVQAIKRTAGEDNVKMWSEVKLELISFLDPKTRSTVGALRRVVNAVATRMNQSPDEVVRHCIVVLAAGGIEKSLREIREVTVKAQRRREAIIPSESLLNITMRYRAQFMRVRERAIANIERDQRARDGTLSEPLRIELNGD